MARVSVVVSHFDRQRLLVEALDSIAAQTYRDFEVIVVNDHGADSRGLVEDFAARSAGGASPIAVRYDYRPVNAGVAATRNRGVALASGEFIAYLDDDDLWRPHHLHGLVSLLDARPYSGLVYGDAEIWRMERVSPGISGAGTDETWRPAEFRTLAVAFDAEELYRNDYIVPGGMMHRRSLYEAVGPFDERLYVSDDWDWLLRVNAASAIDRLPHVVVTVRIWPDCGNLSATVNPQRLAALAQIERRHNTPRLEPKTFWEVAESVTFQEAVTR